MAVLAIVLTAPLGALATSLLGPVLLEKSSKTDEGDSEAPAADNSPVPAEEVQHSEKAISIDVPDLDSKSGSHQGIAHLIATCL